MTKLVALGLLASAFAPVVAILAILQSSQLGWAAWLVIGLCVATVLLLAGVLRSLTRVQERRLDPKQVRRADERLLGFAASYIIPVAVAVFAEDDAVALMGTFALVALIAMIYVRGQMYHLNPTLALAGFRLYEVTETNDTVTMLLTRRQHLPQNEPIDARYVGDYVAIQIGRAR